MKRTTLWIGAALLSLSSLQAAGAAPARPTVAVLYFDYDGKNEELALLKKGLAQMLISDLSPNASVRIVERARLQEIIDELKLNQTNKIDPATANKIGKLLGAQYMVMGGYFDLMGTLRIDTRVVEVETGKVIKATGAAAKPDEFLDLEQRIAREVNAILSGAVPAAAAQGKTTAKAPPAAPKKLPAKVAVQYSKALDAIDRKDKATAKKELEAVVQEQPDFVLASLDLATIVQ